MFRVTALSTALVNVSLSFFAIPTALCIDCCMNYANNRGHGDGPTVYRAFTRNIFFTLSRLYLYNIIVYLHSYYITVSLSEIPLLSHFNSYVLKSFNVFTNYAPFSFKRQMGQQKNG